MSDLPGRIEGLLVMADNKFVLGDRLVEVGIGAPEVEAKLACIALAQSELGHARLLYQWANEELNELSSRPALAGLDASGEVEHQTGRAFESIVECDDWIALVAGLYGVETAIDAVLEALRQQREDEVTKRLHKMLQEQPDSIEFARGWAERLNEDEGLVPQTFQESLEVVLAETDPWLEGLEEDAGSSADALLPDPFPLVQTAREAREPLLFSRGGTHARQSG